MTGKDKNYRKCNNIRPCRLTKYLSSNKLCYLNINESNCDIQTHTSILRKIYELSINHAFETGQDISFTGMMTLGVRKRKVKYFRPIYNYDNVDGKKIRREVIFFDTNDYKMSLMKVKLNGLFFRTYSIKACYELRKVTYKNRMNYKNYLGIV